jgi:hypothetical protein
MDRIREAICTALDDSGLTAAEVSAAVGEAPGYLDSFLHHGNPRRLPPRVRWQLSHFLGLPRFVLRDQQEALVLQDREPEPPVLRVIENPNFAANRTIPGKPGRRTARR